MANQYTKDSIKTRMYKQAASLWDIRNIENLGPIAKLLIESLAAEMFKLSGELYTVESRLLEKVASALTPHTALTARPSHAIATARPYSCEAILLCTDKLNYRNPKTNKKQKLRSSQFTPLYETSIINAEAKYLALPNEFNIKTADHEWETVAKMSSKAIDLSRKLWIGVKFGSNVLELTQLPLYVDIPFVSEKTNYLHMLSHCKCTIGDRSVSLKKGIDYQAPQTVIDKYDINRKITEEIINKYDPHFITLVTSGIKIDDLPRSNVPDELIPLLPNDFIAKCDADTVWIRIDFPAVFSSEILSQINIQMNAFVAVNKYPVKVSKKVDVVSTVIPLEKNDLEYFVSVESVRDSKDNPLCEISISSDGSSAGDYSVRRGGCERFNTMEAKDYISRLTDLLYNESIAFTSSDKDELKDKIEQIQKLIGLLDQQNKELPGGTELTSYLITGCPAEENTTLTVEYLLTNGEFANDIYAGEILECSTNPDIEEHSVRFLTTTQGGTASPSAERRLDIYRYLLLSHGSIYSKEDICNFCKSKYGEYITAVEVKLGYAVGKSSKDGFVRTLDVYIKSSGKAKQLIKEELSTDIYSDLKRFSPQTYNYRVWID